MEDRTKKANAATRRDKHQIFSIRKFNVGVASVAIAAFWMISGSQVAAADETVSPATTTVVAEATPESEAGEIAELAEVTSPEITAPVVETPVPVAEAPAEQPVAPASPAAAEATQEASVKVKPVAKAEQAFSWQAVPAARELLENAAELEAAGAVISYLNGAPTFGQTVAKVLVTYVDGTTEVVDVPVKISSAAVRKETTEEPEKLEEGTGFRKVYAEEADGTTTWVENNFQGNIKHANNTQSDKVEDFIKSDWEAVDTDGDGKNDTINWTHVFNEGLMNRNQYAYYFTVPDVVGPVTDLKVVQTHRNGTTLNTSDGTAFERNVRNPDEGPIIVGNGNNIGTGEYEIRKISEGTGNKTAAIYANKDFLHSSLDRTESPVTEDSLQDDYYVIYSNRSINAHSYWTVTYSTKILNPDSTTDKLSYIIGSNGSTTTEHADMAIGVFDKPISDFKAPLELTSPELTPVTDTTSLTAEEKQAVKDAIKAANPTLNLTDDQIVVGDNGATTVTVPGKLPATLTPDQTVTEKPDTEAPTLTEPAKTEVADKTNLTDDEKTAVKEAVNTANPDLPADTEITVGNDGTVTVTVPGKDAATLTPDQTVTEKPADTTAPTLNEPAKTPVANPTNLTDEEKAKVAEEVKKANPELPADAAITVGNDGSVTVTVPGKDPATLTPAQTVTEKPADTTAPTVKEPAKTEVADKTNLTDDEKAKVAEEVKKANPELPADAAITVGNDGSVTVTVPGKDPATLTPAQTVTEKPADTTAPTVKEPAKTEVADKTNLTDEEKAKVAEEVKKANPELPADAAITVGNDGSVTVTVPGKDPATLTPAQTVTEKPADTTAPTLNEPAKTPVANPTNLTDDEKAKVAEEVKKVNPELPADATIEVGNDGTVTVKVPGKDPATLTPAQTVTEKPADTTAPTLNEPAKTPVANPTNLTDDEKAKVAEEVKKVNPELPADATIEVGNDGTVTVKVPGKDPATLTPAQTVTEKPADTTAPTLNEPAKTPVANPTNLTDDEKAKVAEEVKKVNPDLPADAEITVGNDGAVTVKVPGKDAATLTPAQTVTETPAEDTTAPAKPVLTPNTDGSVAVKVPADADATSVTVNVTDPTTGTSTPVTLEKQPDGSWTSTNPDVVPNIPAGADTATIPADKVKDGSDVTATSTDGTNTSELATVKVPVVDTDGGGRTDEQEGTDGTDPKDPTDDKKDTDKDGITDDKDQNPTDPTDEKDPAVDTDGDGITDDQEVVDGTDPKAEDTDKDGVTDGTEKKDGTSPTESDTDGGGRTDGQEKEDGTDPKDPTDDKKDTDKDGITDDKDQNPTDPTDEKDPAVDTDGDGITDDQEVVDGTDPKAEDTDKDGVTDGTEKKDGTNPLSPDTDGGGRTDGQEKEDGTDPKDPTDDKKDTDKDGITDDKDQDPTDPTDKKDPAVDTDGDGITDDQEVVDGTDPKVEDTDKDGVTDGTEKKDGTDPLTPDTDGGGRTDGQEKEDGTDPKDPSDDKKDTDLFDPKAPAKTPVADPTKLTDDEKAKVADEVKKANPELPAGTTVTVDDKGTATITYPDGSVDTIDPTKTVVATPVSENFEPKAPAKTPVADPTKLTDDEKAKVADEVKKANPELPAGTTVTVDDKGTATITYPDGSVDTIAPTKTVVATPVSDNFDPKAPAKTPVADPTKLTDDEKAKVAEEVKKANPELPAGTTVTVDDKGTATVTYPDGSVDTIDPTKTVVALVSTPEVTVAKNGTVTVTPSEGSVSLVITYTDKEGNSHTATVTQSVDGTWTIDDSSLVIDSVTGVVTIPADRVEFGTIVSATATDKDNNKSDTVEVEVHASANGPGLINEGLPGFDIDGDSDGDGVKNGQEITDGTDPFNAKSYKKANMTVKATASTKAANTAKQLPKTGDSKGTVALGLLTMLAAFGLMAKKRKQDEQDA